MAEPILYPRFVRSCLEEALDDTPVVLIHGPRQSGKTTLARISALDSLPRLLQLAAGVVVYDGENVVGFGNNLYAFPIRAIWEIT